MLSSRFDYHRPGTLDEALKLLAELDDAKILAGGQSLIPVMKLRLAAPAHLVDINRVPGLDAIEEGDGSLRIGALVRHNQMVSSGTVAGFPMLAAAAPQIADPIVRNLGTVGGSLAHADPAGDLPAVALALDAEMVIAGAGGQRRAVPAREFFRDYLETAIGPSELLVEVRVPRLGTDWGTAYEKFHRVAQAWAIVGVAALVRRDGDTIAEARVGLTNMGPTPVRAVAAEQALVGVATANGGIAAAAGHAADGTDPPADLSAQADYRRHLAQVLTRRAVHRAIAAGAG